MASLELLIKIWKYNEQSVIENLQEQGLEEHEAISLQAILEIRDNLRELLALSKQENEQDMSRIADIFGHSKKVPSAGEMRRRALDLVIPMGDDK